MLQTGKFLKIIFIFLLFSFFMTPGLAIAKANKKDYKNALKEWTREEEKYQREDFYASLKWYATFLSPSFIHAQVNELARIYDYSQEERRRAYLKMQDQHGDYTSFFISFYAYNFKAADLDAKNPLWVLKMRVNGQDYDPVRIDEVRKITPLQQVLYPYVATWSRHYYVYFPQIFDLEAKKVELQINGPNGESILRW